jgi:hypothetical protein
MVGNNDKACSRYRRKTYFVNFQLPVSTRRAQAAAGQIFLNCAKFVVSDNLAKPVNLTDQDADS